MKNHNIEHVALFVDLDNFVGFCLGLGLPIDLTPEIDRLTELGRIIIRRSFGDIYKLPISAEQKSELRKMLQNNQIQHEDIPYQNAFKNSSDIRLVVEAISAAYLNESIDLFAVVANDRDYLPLFSKLREMGKNIIGFGANRDSTPDLYVKSCDYFFYHETLTSNISRPLEKDGIDMDLSQQHVEESGLMDSKFNKNDAVKLLVDAMTVLDAKGISVAPGAAVIQIMRRLKPDFDFNIYGFINFKQLCEYAADAKVVDIEHQGAIFNLQLKNDTQEIEQKNTIAISSVNDNQAQLSIDDLRNWFENKVRIRLPDLADRILIYTPLFNKDIYKQGISFRDLTKKVGSEIINSKSAQESCYKILYTLYRASCFSCTPGTTAYNPIVHGINIAANDYSALDIQFIKNTIKVFTNEHKSSADPALWSELFFGSKDMEDIIKEIIRQI